MKNSVSTPKPFLRMKFCIHFSSCAKYKIEDQSERVRRASYRSKPWVHRLRPTHPEKESRNTHWKTWTVRHSYLEWASWGFAFQKYKNIFLKKTTEKRKQTIGSLARKFCAFSSPREVKLLLGYLDWKDGDSDAREPLWTGPWGVVPVHNYFLISKPEKKKLSHWIYAASS